MISRVVQTLSSIAKPIALSLAFTLPCEATESKAQTPNLTIEDVNHHQNEADYWAQEAEKHRKEVEYYDQQIERHSRQAKIFSAIGGGCVLALGGLISLVVYSIKNDAENLRDDCINFPGKLKRAHGSPPPNQITLSDNFSRDELKALDKTFKTLVPPNYDFTKMLSDKSVVIHIKKVEDLKSYLFQDNANLQTDYDRANTSTKGKRNLALSSFSLATETPLNKKTHFFIIIEGKEELTYPNLLSKLSREFSRITTNYLNSSDGHLTISQVNAYKAQLAFLESLQNRTREISNEISNAQAELRPWEDAMHEYLALRDTRN